MMPPTSIDGTDITGATIDGTDVQEITVDGQTVFSAQTLPVAYSNLVAWYPFDSAEYGGSNADDVTAILGGSGDDTAYNGTINGAVYESAGGVKDIKAGADSGAFKFDENDNIECGNPLDSTSPFTVTTWAKFDRQDGFDRLLNTNDNSNGFRLVNSANLVFDTENGGDQQRVSGSTVPNDVFIHIACVFTGTQNELYEDGSLINTEASSGSGSDPLNFRIGEGGPTVIENRGMEGNLDDVRVYNTDLTASQINQIYNNTKP